MAHKADALPSGSRLNSYDIIGLLGTGGFGITYRARHRLLDRKKEVAIKEFFPQGAKRLEGGALVYPDSIEDEVRLLIAKFEETTTILGEIAHPRIVKVLAYFEANNTFYQVMELIDGQSLKKLLAARGRLSMAEVAALLDPVVEALRYLHRSGIVHRDVAPDNIMVRPDGTPILIDFGGVKNIGDGLTRSLTALDPGASAAIAKPYFSAPELYLPEPDITPLVDIYSLGAVAYEALAGSKPTDSNARSFSIGLGRSDPLEKALDAAMPGLFHETRTMLMATLAMDPKKRVPTIDGVRAIWRESDVPIPIVDSAKEPPTVPLISTQEDQPQYLEQKASIHKTVIVTRPQTNRRTVLGGVIIAGGAVSGAALGAFYTFRRQSADLVIAVPVSKASINLQQRPLSQALAAGYKPLQQFDHASTVFSVAVTPDGKTIVSGAGDKTLKLWDAAAGSLNRTLSGHTGSVFAVATTPDGKTIVSGSTDTTLTLWDIAAGKPIRTLTGNAGSVFAVAITPDSKTIVSGLGDYTLKLWDVATGSMNRNLAGHEGSVLAVAITPDGKSIVSGSADNTLKLWDLAAGMPIRSLIGHKGWVRAVAISPNGKTAICASADATLKIWDLASGLVIRTLSGHVGSVFAVAITPDGKTIVSGSTDNTLRLWDAATGKPIRTLTGHAGSVIAVAVTPDGKTIVSGSADNTVKVWDAATGNLIRTQIACGDYGSAVFGPDGLPKLVRGKEDEIYAFSKDNRYVKPSELRALGYDVPQPSP